MRTTNSVGLWLSCAAQLDNFGIISVSDLDGIMMICSLLSPVPRLRADSTVMKLDRRDTEAARSSIAGR